MGLADRQRLLARLSTDAPLRESLARDFPATVAALGLSPDDASWLAALPADLLDDYAGSLIAKRRGEVAKLLPATIRVLGDARYAALFRDYAARPIPDGPRKHRDDAVAFAKEVRRGRCGPAWLADVARLEAATLVAHDLKRSGTACPLGHRPDDLSRAVEGGTTPERRPSLVLWFRVPIGGPLRRVVLSRPW